MAVPHRVDQPNKVWPCRHPSKPFPLPIRRRRVLLIEGWVLDRRAAGQLAPRGEAADADLGRVEAPLGGVGADGSDRLEGVYPARSAARQR